LSGLAEQASIREPDVITDPADSGARWSRTCRIPGVAGLAEQAPTRDPEVITDPADPRLVLYRLTKNRDHREYQIQVRQLAGRALRLDASQLSGPLGQLDCAIGVHYSWECLRRLKEAQVAGSRELFVESILVPIGTPPALLDLAASISPIVYLAEQSLIGAEFAQEGSSRKETCNYVVACPLSKPLKEMQPPFVVLDGIGSSQNVGQILRTAYHLGINSVVVSRSTWNCLNGRACRVSMGWLYHMDFHVAEPLTDALHSIQESGVRVYAAENQFDNAVAPHQPPGDRNWALVVGHEDVGVSAEILKLSDSLVCVPSQRGESLNVAHATAICLYELGRHSGL